ncbi:hypothetical protein THRCLA_07957 [Thraustotheca clavata]|uniref:FHA domain-containing protein n=1 Tax=Thraustotheca clavata TaxID=74557 RepID=A0A1V9ZBH7_9STRA|nr:hypothetical protein THRCLA_07957 [Thraustotheca clavata]
MDEKKIEKEFVSARPPLAYAKLQGVVNENQLFEALVTQLPVEIGRGIQSASTPNRINMGELMSVSRQHASIDWSAEKGCFELKCLGKNGLYAAGASVLVVDLIHGSCVGLKVEKDQTIALKPKMPLRIGGARIYFLPAAFEKANPNKTIGLSVDETVDAIYNCFKDIDYEVGGRNNVMILVKSYFDSANPNFKRVSISATGEPRYIWIRPEGTEDSKKRPGNTNTEAKKKQKVMTQEVLPPVVALPPPSLPL